jgi:ribosomal protein L44E
MTQHFTRSTISADFYCSKCRKFTQHRIDSGRKGPCLNCIERSNVEHAQNEIDQRRTERQSSLFREVF